MTSYLKSGKRFNVSSKEAMDLHDSLPVGTYTVLFDEENGRFFLERIEDFDIKGKLYGKTTRHADRVLNTFESRSASTGVLLTGEKGSGKTLLAKKICMDAAAKGISTLVINQPWRGEVFNTFIQMINQPTIVLFDEFEKVYSEQQGNGQCQAQAPQELLLTLLDGVYPSKKLFLLTCNDEARIDTNFLNRPGRIFYAIKYKGLDADFIREYCEDNLNDKQHIPQLCSVSALFDHFNFDMLKAMVEEMNRYGESPSEVLELLNAKPEYGASSSFKIQMFVDDKCLKKEHVNDGNDIWKGNPLKQEINLYCIPDPDASRYQHIKCTMKDLRHVNSDNGEYVFVTSDNMRLVLRKEEESHKMDYNMVLDPKAENLSVRESFEEEEKKVD
eukprot:CAMPEP_0196824686 /NCGR_PEP_ID=MMETSP1362-20130617/92624_1 /TAXON_ID=163516 /ORGANISM="Leptocylindrus danicus, Strain CCMP1856" /LENGTH=386 /DNA_ID=CAMNT_0042205009 /DNA_START=50 /DNA_END=1210 /DNA_ORIENTATION=+